MIDTKAIGDELAKGSFEPVLDSTMPEGFKEFIYDTKDGQPVKCYTNGEYFYVELSGRAVQFSCSKMTPEECVAFAMAELSNNLGDKTKADAISEKLAAEPSADDKPV